MRALFSLLRLAQCPPRILQYRDLSPSLIANSHCQSRVLSRGSYHIPSSEDLRISLHDSQDSRRVLIRIFQQSPHGILRMNNLPYTQSHSGGHRQHQMTNSQDRIEDQAADIQIKSPHLSSVSLKSATAGCKKGTQKE